MTEIRETADNEEPILARNGASTDITLKRLHWWLLVGLNIIFLLGGQSAAVLLGRIYYDRGGNSTWMATLVQAVGFPILFIPYVLTPASKGRSNASNAASVVVVALIYLIIGAVTAADNLLYSVGLLYLSASTYSLISATQLVFSAIFSFFINHQKITSLICNSVVALTLSASFLALNDDTDVPSGASKWMYVLGVITTVGASALYALLLSLMQLSFQKFLKKETFSVVLELQIWTSAMATFVSIAGLFASGEWGTLQGEMDSFSTGKISYVMILVWTAVAWQIYSVGTIGLIFMVSSLFSNVICTLSLAVTPIVSVIILHDKVNTVKIFAMLMAIWGFANYTYQNYLDDLKERRKKTDVCSTNDSLC